MICHFLHAALTTLSVLGLAASTTVQSEAALHLENFALQYQLGVLQRSMKRPRLAPPNRLLWAWLCGTWNDWRQALLIVKPDTAIAWHRRGFQLFWTWKFHRGKNGRSPVPKDVWDLIRMMDRENSLRGAPWIRGELLKVGIDIGDE